MMVRFLLLENCRILEVSQVALRKLQNDAYPKSLNKKEIVGTITNIQELVEIAEDNGNDIWVK